MNVGLTTSEAVESALYRIKRYIGLGACPGCALKLAAFDLGCARDKLEDLWIGSQLEDIE